MDRMIRRTAKIVASAFVLFSVSMSLASAASTYTDRSLFTPTISNSITDDYEGAGYAAGEIYPFYNDAAMSAVLGETDYTSTAYPDWNILVTENGNRSYCTGCNGSLELGFTTTSIGTSDGVYGVGLDYRNQTTVPYFAFVMFGDGTTGNFGLQSSNAPDDGSLDFFFGITSNLLIKSIHLGLSGGGTTQDGYFQMDNLTIGAVSAIPLPAALPLYGAGLGLLGLLGWRKRKYDNPAL